MTQFDPIVAKQIQYEQWNQSATGWKKHDERLRETSQIVTEQMLKLAAVWPGQAVLDIASGTGEPGLPAARLVGPMGRVVLTDMSEAMIEVAEEKARAQGLTNVEFKVVDGEVLEVGENNFDVALCRWGIMFMPDPVKCMAQAYRALKPGGRLSVAVWGTPERNPFFTIPLRTLAQHVEVPAPPPGAPGLFSLADPERLRSVLEKAGSRDVTVTDLEFPMGIAADGHDYWNYIRELAAPIAALFAKVPAEKQEHVSRQIAAAAEAGQKDGGVRLSGYALFATGVK